MIVYTKSKEQIRLADKPLSSGAEGEVYLVESAPSRFSNIVVKIYYQAKRSKQLERKIDFMAKNPPAKVSGPGFMIGWPLDSVFDSASNFIGFVMPMAFKGSKALVNLTAVKISNKLDLEWHQKYDRSLGKSSLVARLKLLNNIAIPIHLLHQTGKYVLKDFKPQNVLITHTGQVTIVDMDSVQIMDGLRLLFPATAATDGYMPPEFYTRGVGRDQMKPLDKSWDYFALGVVYYQILFGLHPFVVTPWVMKDDSCNEISQNIAQSLFPFGTNAHKVRGFPDLHNKFQYLPQPVKELFLKALGDVPNQRPCAEMWGREIHKILSNVGPIPQPFDYLDVPVSNFEFSASGGSKTIVVKSSPSWSIGSQLPSWGHVSCTANNLTIRVDENTSNNLRTGWFIIKAGSKSVKITVSQAARTPSPTHRPTPSPNPGPAPSPNPGPAPDNHLTKAILTMVFCCVPLGISSLLEANKVGSLWAQGKYDEAKKAADSADTLANWSICIGLVCIIVSIIASLV